MQIPLKKHIETLLQLKQIEIALDLFYIAGAKLLHRDDCDTLIIRCGSYKRLLMQVRDGRVSETSEYYSTELAKTAHTLRELAKSLPDS